MHLQQMKKSCTLKVLSTSSIVLHLQGRKQWKNLVKYFVVRIKHALHYCKDMKLFFSITGSPFPIDNKMSSCCCNCHNRNTHL